MTEVELAQAAALAQCRFSPGSTAKSFVRRVHEYAAVAPTQDLTPKQSDFLNSLAHQYRGQIGKCMAVACAKCEPLPPHAERDDIRVALDSFIEGRNEYAKHVDRWRKAALAAYNKVNETTFARPYEYATKVAPSNRRAETRGDIFCRFCGERLFAGVKQPHKLVKESDDAQRHLMICALQVLAGMRESVAPGYRAVPMEAVWSSEPVALPSADSGPLFGGGR